MKKLVTLTASALLMASMATAVSAAETTTGSVTNAPTAPATTTSATANFVGNQNGFSFPIPAYWDARVKNTEFTADQLKAKGENGVYLINFTYTPEMAAPNGSLEPVKFASIRGYDRTAWDAISNKDVLGKVLNTTGNVVYVLESVTANPFSNASDMERFSNLLQGVRSGVSSNFTTMVVPTVPGTPTTPTTPATPGTEVPVDPNAPLVPTNDPSKYSDTPTPTIDLTTMTPFYKSPGGTMIGYLGPQKLDTTGNGTTDPASGQWVEIYTWMGLAWIVIE
ncbi:hypothetical protein [Saccharibacillus qingshengii]|uniref:hypothetical protein n=1 Tax=Saccharibacillus qingshengii TaxID=1763540 RepID=UPI001551CEAD|nr:hypothetical protein [Saccharibacillus qingshengii]